MKYELAKKLSDAGFPSRRELCANPCEGSCFPILSELIGGCGKEFGSLVQNLNRSFRATESIHTNTHFVMKRFGDGSTAEEAVANLWLALNTK